jgi:hypothetical protein
MATDLEPLRRGIIKLYEKRKIGDLTEKKFQAQLAEKTVDLYRALVRDRMADGEKIELEHHTILSHLKLTKSVLREPEQFATSLFATDRRLFRVRSTVILTKPPTGDKRDETEVDALSYKRMASLKVHREIRWGEAGVGAGFAAIGVGLAPWLDITGPFVIGFGVLGILHAFIIPTRWMEVVPENPIPDMDPMNINVLRKKSAKALMRFLKEKLKR